MFTFIVTFKNLTETMNILAENRDYVTGFLADVDIPYESVERHCPKNGFDTKEIHAIVHDSVIVTDEVVEEWKEKAEEAQEVTFTVDVPIAGYVSVEVTAEDRDAAIAQAQLEAQSMISGLDDYEICEKARGNSTLYGLMVYDEGGNEVPAEG